MSTDTRDCTRCDKKDVRVRKDGRLWRHWDAGRNETCESGEFTEPQHVHQYTWADDDNGHSGSFCECGQEEPVSEAASTVDDMTQQTNGQYLSEDPPLTGPLVDKAKELGAVSEFTAPTKVTAVKTSVTGQKEEDRDQWGRYLLPHPVTGLYSNGGAAPTRRNGWTRATTFAKTAADTYALTRYDERLTLLGATLRPDVVALAHGKDVRADKAELDKLVTQVKEAAGSKVAANIGTAVHGFTERVDAGLLHMDDVPITYVEHLRAYQQAMNQASVEVVGSMIERTTFVPQFNVAGKFDRIVRLPDGTYCIADLKTGRDLSYGQMEIAVQLSLYAHGVNSAGVYDWNTNQWQGPRSYGDSIETGPWQVPEVRTDVGLVMHLPVQGDLAGRCALMAVDLRKGWEIASLCDQVTQARKYKNYMIPWESFTPVTQAPAPAAADVPKVPGIFLDAAYNVRTREGARQVWSSAQANGCDKAQLDRLTEVLQGVLSTVDTNGAGG